MKVFATKQLRYKALTVKAVVVIVVKMNNCEGAVPDIYAVT